MISPLSAGTLGVRRIIGVQAVVVLFGAVASLVLYGRVAAEAMLAGGAVALTNTLLLAWRMRGDPRSADQSAQGHLWTFYRSSLERFFVVASLLVTGMGPLGFKPLPLLAGFVLGQLALVFSFLIIRRIE